MIVPVLSADDKTLLGAFDLRRVPLHELRHGFMSVVISEDDGKSFSAADPQKSVVCHRILLELKHWWWDSLKFAYFECSPSSLKWLMRHPNFSLAVKPCGVTL